MTNTDMNELTFEHNLVDYLSKGRLASASATVNDQVSEYVTNRQLWKYRPDIKTDEQLWANFKTILENHNQDRLKEPLSASEFAQVRQAITNLHTPYEAGQFIYGLNGITQIEIDLDSGEHTFLTVFDQDKVGTGAVYEVVTQIEREPVVAGYPKRRFDTTLLINGLPIIQIEEKQGSHDVNEALNQMQQYIHERQYTGIFSTLQILVAMTPNAIRYMANTTEDSFNKDFAFQWQREEDNKPVRDWKQFCDLVLSIPMAHQMATSYMILDGTKNHQSLKVMRSYQVYATQRVIDKIKHTDFSFGDNKLGYVWHTTGSGKTITSFKTAWLASRLPNVNKVVFVVDRKALTRQTNANYQAYDPDATGDVAGIVKDTRNTYDLRRKLQSNDRAIIVTSEQKLNSLIKSDRFKAPDKNIVFIVDEAHRTTNGDSFENIQKAFPRGAWVGYTGTPMFDDTTNGKRTEDVFGKLLHAYTIREAIADQNVLGFKVDFETTIPEQQLKTQYLPGFYKRQHPEWTDEQINYKIEHLSDKDIDDTLEPSVYDENPKHVELVVADIFNNWQVRSQNCLYNSLLTTHVGGGKPSTKMAMMYYREFKRVNSERKAQGLPTLKVGVTFSLNANNDDNMLETNKGLAEAISDYNQEFGTNFSLETAEEYNQDLISRLDRSADDNKYLDLVIVVDRLLTGFDAPKLNTLYVDRILRNASLIQAYSRTNRISDMKTKSWGQIVNYRWPAKNEQLMRDALQIYANKDSANVEENGGQNTDLDGDVLAVKFSDLLNDTKKVVEKLRKMTDDFTNLPASEGDRTEMVSAMRKYTTNVNKLKQYSGQEDNAGEEITGYDPANPDKLTRALGMEPEEEKVLTYSLANDLKHWLSSHKQIPVEQLDLELTHIKDVKVNYDYLKELVEQLANQVHDGETEEAKATEKSIKQIVDTIDDETHAEHIRQMVSSIAKGDYPEDAEYPLQINDFDRFVEQHTNRTIKQTVLNFQIKWGITQVIKEEDFRNMLLNHRIGKNDLDNDGKLTKLKKDAASQYKDYAQDSKVVAMKKLEYRNKLMDAVMELADKLVKM